MLHHALLVFAIASPPSGHGSGCTLAGPPAYARWSGDIPQSTSHDAPVRRVADVPLPGAASRFDYQSFDSASSRLFIAHMGAGRLVVFDTHTNAVIADVSGVATVTGVLAVPREHRAYASAAGDGAVVTVEDSTFEIVARTRGLRFPDGLAYAPEQRRVFVSDEVGRQDVVLDAVSGAVIGRVDLGGEAGNTQYDHGSRCILVAVQTTNQLVAIDPATTTIVRRVTLDRAVRYPHGVSIDAVNRLAFIAGEQSATVGVLDLRTLELRQVVPVGREPDVLAFDPGFARLYVAAESGAVAVFAERERALIQLGWYQAPGAHSVAVDPRTHRIYLPLANVQGRPVLRILDPVGSR